MANYGRHFSTLRTPQSEPARADQVENLAGGYAFKLDKWARLDRWLILGAEGGTYYASEQKLVRENAQTVLECLKEDGRRTVARIVEISDSGRAPKNDPAIFALAMAAGDPNPDTQVEALRALPKVCRIGTHLFHFARDVEGFRGWGPRLRRAISDWYLYRTPDKIAVQLLKYQQRDGWGHRDLLRLAHPGGHVSPGHNAAFRWCVGAEMGDRAVKRGKDAEPRQYRADADALPRLLAAYDQLKASPSPKATAGLVREHRFTHEMVPNDHKNSPEVWEALLEQMPQTALVRNLAKMTAVGLFKPMGASTKLAAAKLTDVDALKEQRVHPISILLALKVYQQGHGEKGKLRWEPEREIVDALDAAFYLAFQAVEPTGKNLLLALDVSGSMDGGTIAGCPGITPRIAAAAMAMVTARCEKNWHIVGFTSALTGYGGKWGGGAPGLTKLDISPKERLDDVVRKMQALPMGGTDCSLPMLYAEKAGIDVDCFQIYTDNETWAGPVHPFQALASYRKARNRGAKLAVVGMTATDFTIADPNDGGMMDFVGFDSAAPALLADFARQQGAPPEAAR